MPLLLAALTLLASAKKPSAGICVTGQLARLELESKLKHLIRPNAGDFDIDLIIIVDPSSARHVNMRDVKGEGAKLGESPLDAADIPWFGSSIRTADTSLLGRSLLALLALPLMPLVRA